MPKVLCLHGLGQDGQGFYDRSIRPIAERLPGWDFHCPDGIFPLSTEVNKFQYSKDAVAITKEKVTGDAEIGAVLTTQAIVKCLEVEDRIDPLRACPRSTSLRRSLLKSHGEAFLQASPYGNMSQDELVKRLTGAQLRSWIVQVPPTFPDAGMWTSFDASLEYLSEYYNQHGPFDGIIGFSQGGMLASIIVKLLAGLDNGYEPEFNPQKSKAKPPSFVLFGSVMNFDPNNSLQGLRDDLMRLSKEYSLLKKAPTNILSIWGTKDKFFSQADFEEMSRTNNSAIVATFPFGHLLPTKGEWPSSLAKWMSDAVEGRDIKPLEEILHLAKSKM